MGLQVPPNFCAKEKEKSVVWKHPQRIRQDISRISQIERMPNHSRKYETRPCPYVHRDSAQTRRSIHCWFYQRQKRYCFSVGSVSPDLNQIFLKA